MLKIFVLFVLFVFKKSRVKNPCDPCDPCAKNIRVIRVQKIIVSFVFKYFIRVQKQPFLSCSNDVVMMFIA